MHEGPTRRLVARGRYIPGRRQARPTAEQLARAFHESYERLAPTFGYNTREASAVDWENVPEPNRSLMIATAWDVLQRLPGLAG